MDVRLDLSDSARTYAHDTTPSFISSLGGFVDPGRSTWSNEEDSELELHVYSRSNREKEDEIQYSYTSASSSPTT